MESIQFDAFNPTPYVNHIPEIKIAKNKKSLELIIIIGGVIIIGLIVHHFINRYLEESESLKNKNNY